MSCLIQLQGLGGRLKKERERVGLSQEQCAELSGITRVSQSRYEVGRTSPGLDYLEKLSDLGIDVHFILFGRQGCHCVYIGDHTVFGRAIEVVNAIMARHKVRPPAAFRGVAVLQAHSMLARGDSGVESLSLNDLLAGAIS